jgi:predicted GNAT family N-acyltransferase
MVTSNNFEVRLVGATDVRPLRREVLRVAMPEATVDFEGDDDGSTYHLAVFDTSDSIVAVSSWMERPLSEDPDRRAIQLRGMATKVHLQGFGLGALLLDFGIRTAREKTVDLVWANARDSALSFYLRNGFEIIGEGFTESVTRLPHHRVRRIV